VGVNVFKCKKCGAIVSFNNDYYNTHKDRAFKAWNRRYEPSNEPLTVDELKCLNVKEWIWIEVISPTNCSEAKSAYYRKTDGHKQDEVFWCGYPGWGTAFDYADYGTFWLAYRYKPGR